ncbi:peptidoglycan DD-metalloendopeptidase family protein [Muriicola sp. Z0-33]|uniref:peptidoglycan DD-metalloendopeptidase family protein n=1 Tax=Muriicola sp. Z0-33 TaxID=2816957 RepID=UPI0022380D89|nr:peptidoglycan DD-metalloendopeptidase family protein [Muriicola sp. Z0-33]MCW5515913.1 peptidoglycan DD-metalloendopeptidase family protein [Muriicola sp. Z0-33]
MTKVEKVIYSISNSSIRILDNSIPLSEYTPIDLSVFNVEVEGLDISQPDICQLYIDKILKKRSAKVAYGGYLEQRSLYKTYDSFRMQDQAPRNIHLGTDFWAKAGTKVHSPLRGQVHSFGNNSAKGDYGPTIVLEHIAFHRRFYTLYGHLSISSIQDLYPGKPFEAGEVLGILGKTEINVNYAPHLHFQLICDIGEYNGDYPGVCSAKELDYYKNNCPDPNLLLKL